MILKEKKKKRISECTFPSCFFYDSGQMHLSLNTLPPKGHSHQRRNSLNPPELLEEWRLAISEVEVSLK